MITATEEQAFLTLARLAQAEPDLRSSLRDLIMRTAIPPEDLDRLAEVLVLEASEKCRVALEEKKPERCSFCLRPKTGVRHLVVARHAGICDECVEIARETVVKATKKAPG